MKKQYLLYDENFLDFPLTKSRDWEYFENSIETTPYIQIGIAIFDPLEFEIEHRKKGIGIDSFDVSEPFELNGFSVIKFTIWSSSEEYGTSKRVEYRMESPNVNVAFNISDKSDFDENTYNDLLHSISITDKRPKRKKVAKKPKVTYTPIDLPKEISFLNNYYPEVSKALKNDSPEDADCMMLFNLIEENLVDLQEDDAMDFCCERLKAFLDNSNHSEHELSPYYVMLGSLLAY